MLALLLSPHGPTATTAAGVRACSGTLFRDTPHRQLAHGGVNTRP